MIEIPERIDGSSERTDRTGRKSVKRKFDIQKYKNKTGLLEIKEDVREEQIILNDDGQVNQEKYEQIELDQGSFARKSTTLSEEILDLTKLG